MRLKIVSSLKELDKENTRYLSLDNIKLGFHNAEFKLSSNQVKEMLKDIVKNKEDQYNYHILLCALFGDDYERETTEPSKPSARSRTRFDEDRSSK